MILALGLQAVEKFGGGGALIGLEPVSLSQIDQRVGLFRSCRNNAARTVIFERTPHQHLVIR